MVVLARTLQPEASREGAAAASDRFCIKSLTPSSGVGVSDRAIRYNYTPGAIISAASAVMWAPVSVTSLRRIVLCACTVLAGCGDGEATPATLQTTRECPAIGSDPVRIAAGTFIMGSDLVYPEEGPPRATRVRSFWIDPHEVTNAQFAAFVNATGHVTTAEKPVDPDIFGVPREQIPPELLVPGSAVFVPPDRPSTRYTDW
jgi:formylglycine-generating enzyme required for sulfatase activity